MNVNELPDISKLSLDGGDEKDINGNDNQCINDLDAFLEDEDEDDYQDDIDIIKGKIGNMNNMEQDDDEDEDIDVANNNDMVDID